MKEVLELLDNKNIEYDLIEHEKAYTVEDLKTFGLIDKGYFLKNLFLRNSKGNVHYLVSCYYDKKINLDDLREKLNSTKLSFASPERLMKYMKLEPGSVTPFGILNDDENLVVVVFDKDLIERKVGVHPNVNNASVFVKFEHLKNIIEEKGNQILMIDI